MADSTLIANGTVVTADGEFAGDVYERGEILTEPGHGRFVARSLAAAA